MKADFYYDKRKYTCCIVKNTSPPELRIMNEREEVLALEQGKKVGLQGKKRENSKEVDVLQPYFYNLIKAAVSALEIAEKNQLLVEKNKAILRQNEQIHNLNQQLEVIRQTQISAGDREHKLNQLQLELRDKEVVAALQEQRILQLENELSQLPQTLTSEQIEQKIKAKLSEIVWNRLHPSSQIDLCNAYRFYFMLKSDNFANRAINYSTAGHPLGLVAEREIVAPYFNNLYQFLPVSNKKYTWADLPALVSNQWQAFTDYALDQEEAIYTIQRYRTVFSSDRISQTDKELVKPFLQQWQHSLSGWLAQGETAASIIDQLRQLRNRVSHPEKFHKTKHVEMKLYQWQFKLLWSLLTGSKTSKGALQEIYSNSHRTTKGVLVASNPPSRLNIGNIRC